MAEKASFWAVVHGRVQGVYFRAFVQREARDIGLTGYVRNLAGGSSVEVCAEGDRDKLEKLVTVLHLGPPGARVEKVDVEWSLYSNSFGDFSIRYYQPGN